MLCGVPYLFVYIVCLMSIRWHCFIRSASVVQVLVPMIAYVGAPASGAHFNPIVTFAFMITGLQVTMCNYSS